MKRRVSSGARSSSRPHVLLLPLSTGHPPLSLGSRLDPRCVGAEACRACGREGQRLGRRCRPRMMGDGYSCEELSEVSPDHRFIAYTMYAKDKDSFALMVRDLVTGTLCDKPRADRVSNISWAMDEKALVYIVTNEDRRPYRLFCSIIGSNKDDILILEEPGENIYLNIRHTKDFRFITLNVFSDTHSKVYLIRASDPLSRMTLVWEGESQVHCIVEHHHGRLYLFSDAAREGVRVNSHYLMQCDVESPGPKSWKVPAHLSDFQPFDLPLPIHVCQILSGPNYDCFSSTMRFAISSPVILKRR